MRMTRRHFLSASAASAMTWLGAPAFAAPPREADVVIIGAGAAGIAAARRIMASNRTVAVVEAGSRVGGRCVTDTTTFESPFDRGARWMHNAETNPMIRLARAAGFDVTPAPAGQKIRVGRRNARAGETEDFLATLVRASRALDDAARGRLDMACATALPKDLGDWTSTIEFVLGPSATGKDLKSLSAMDRARAQERTGAISCRQGLGMLIAKLAEGMPISLNTPATRLSWSNRDVSVETSAGRIVARAAIVTASSSVLASGDLKFAPDLPKRQLDAMQKLSLGSYDRIALQLAGNPLGLARDDVLIEQSNNNRTALLLANINGSSLCTIDVAGSFGRDLANKGEAAMTAFATEWLGKLYGSDVAAAVKKTSVTRWDAAPYIMGAMSAAEPGGQFSRRILSEPMGNIFFAGEATHETLWGTIDGAWDSGERAADAALRKIGALRDTAPPTPAAPIRNPATRQRRGTPMAEPAMPRATVNLDGTIRR